ncbi:hypothetical protein DY000_02015210 [Brassica cretica]|uniref:Uncharacterized protein n=1 Tax=Brassica cretica TaxID=69181 RepID=A0ABQ7CY95_BRACR|nr:hypothetical protein DY000_02015210 [Brassica cretica]
MLHRRRALPSCLVPCHPVHGVDALYMVQESSHHLKIITEGSPLLATIGAVMLHRRRALPSCLVPCHPVHGVDALYMVRRRQSWDVGAHDPPLRFLAEKVYCIHFMFLALQESLQNGEPRPKCKTLGFLVVKSSCLVFDLLSGSPILAKVRAIPSNPVLVYPFVWIAGAQRRLCKPPTSSVIAGAQRRLCKPPTSSLIAGAQKDVWASRRRAVRLRGYKDVCISRRRADSGSAEMDYCTPGDIHISF